ncbi:MAG: hypothetical protein RJA58_1074 [Pseudomonadota bacterium]|jgi:KDO2-lipid IV(A) lauroyltransferase
MSRLLTLLVLWGCRLLAFGPRPLLRLVANGLGALTYRLATSRRAIAATNLRICFPNWTQGKQEEIARRHFVCYARAFLERFEIWFGSEARLSARVALKDIHHLEAFAGRPVIILAPHFLGLDAGGVRLQLDRQFASMYSQQSNPVLDDWTRRGRSRFNDPLLVSRQHGMTPLVRALKRGMPLYFLPDMDFGPRDAVFAPFFGEPAATVTTVVRLARSLGAAVVPLVTRMTEDGYEARFYPGWRHPNDDAEETIADGVARMNQFIEARILEMPEQYLWTHRRFKTRPPGAAPVYG